MHYSHLGLDPRKISFKNKTYFEHFHDLCHYQFRYAKKQYPKIKESQLWGLTASTQPNGYSAHEPGTADNGTIAPTAALASWPYVPLLARQAFSAMTNYPHLQLWGEYGFYDAFHHQKKWLSHGHISIDVGPIAPMIENHQTGLCWEVFSKAPEAQAIFALIKKYSP